jgi:hypothetical protein
MLELHMFPPYCIVRPCIGFKQTTFLQPQADWLITGLILKLQVSTA